MKALSIQQPWAWLIVNGFKDVENRTWATKHRGRTLVHASLKFDRDGYDFVRHEFQGIAMPEPEEFERGGIVGEVDITDCVDGMESLWFFGPYGFVLAKAKELPFSPCKGRLGFFDVAEF